MNPEMPNIFRQAVLLTATMGPIDRQMHLIEAEPLSISLAGGEQAALQHLVGGGTDARHEVLGIEGRLFYFS
jgi:hypothetical protein